MSDAPKESQVEILGFDLQRRLGAGGMAEVFLANKRGAEGTYKQLVVKRILPEYSASRRFRHMFVEEAHLATRLNHPNIVQVYEFSHYGDDLLLSMEYVEGADLGKLARAARKSGRRLPYWVSAFIVGEVAKGLHYAHMRKDEGGLPLDIVHRDVSPQNVLISTDGVVKIADFGIASANLFREEVGVLKGKFSYMSPEQARGEKVDRRSDIYALGVVLYELLCGKSPYGGKKEDALAEAVRRGTAQSPRGVDPDVPAQLDAITMTALASSAADRFQTARDMAAAVGRALLEAQQLVDHTSVEEVMRELLGAQLLDGVDEQAQRTLAAVRKPRTSASEASIFGTSRQSPCRRVVREVRHVAVVKLRLEGLEALRQAQGQAAAQHTLDATRATLDDIAFKHGAIWSWGGEAAAHAVVGLMANPSRAPVDAGLIAVDIHDFLASHSEDLPAQMRASLSVVRGIAGGERDDQGHLRHHTLHHPANYLAEQLGMRTPFGKTWVAGGVFRLVRREFRWSDGPVIDLTDAQKHNVPDRMRVYVLLRPLTAEERLAETALNPHDLVGRDAEKADLHAAYHRASFRLPSSSKPPPSSEGRGDGSGRRELERGELVARVIVGEMGIGKTALVDTFLNELPDGVRTHRIECSPVKIDLPYATVADLLRDVTDVSADDPFEQAVATLEKTFAQRGAIPPRVERLIPRLAELLVGKEVQLDDEDAAAQRHDLVVLGVRLLFGVLAAGASVVIVIDGLQWADGASLQVLRDVLAREEKLPVLALLVTRPDDRSAPYIEGLMRSELRGLQPAQQVRLLQARLGLRAGVEAICRELVPRVGGNPYFLLELVDALLERGALEIVEPDDGEPELVRDESRFGEGMESLPTTIEQLVADRLEELPPPEHDVVDWLAVAGGPLTEGDLMALTRLADDEAIVRLCARGLCDRRGRTIDFRHPLARDVAYHVLDAVHRARMHRRLGEHLSSTPSARGLSAAIVAQHLEQGEAPGPAAELYLEAALAARGAYQTLLAVRYFERTLALLPVGDTRRLMAHESLEGINRTLGKGQERRVHLDGLRRLAMESRQARWVAVVLVRTARFHLDEAAMAKGLPVAQRAADMARFARQPDLEVEALIILCELLRDLGDVNGALEACERALEVSSSPRVSRRARAEVQRAKGVLLRRAGRLNAAVESHAKAIAIFKAVGARRREARARNALGFALFVLGRYEDCIAMCLSSIAIDVMIGGRFKVAKTLANIGQSYARLGDFERGLSYLARARDAHQRYDDQDGRIDTNLVTASALIEMERIDDAKELLQQVSKMAPHGGNVYDRIHQLIMQALIERHEHQAIAASAHAAEARQLAEGQALVSYHVYTTAIEAVARVETGDSQAGVMLATTALGAVEGMEGSEYSIEVRSLCCDAVIMASATDKLAGASSSLTADVCRRSLDQVDQISGYIRDAGLRERFFKRPPVSRIVAHAMRFSAGGTGAVGGSDAG